MNRVLSKFLYRMYEILSEECSVTINIAETKVIMICGINAKLNILLKGQKLEEVGKFIYLGSIFTKDGKSKKDIISRYH